MTTKRTAYDVIVAPVITEKATLASEANQVIFKVNRQATKTEIKAAIESLFKVKVKAVEHDCPQGQAEGVQRRQSRVERYEEGRRDARGRAFDRRDDRSLEDNASWRLRHTTRRRPAAVT